MYQVPPADIPIKPGYFVQTQEKGIWIDGLRGALLEPKAPIFTKSPVSRNAKRVRGPARAASSPSVA